MSTKIHSMVHPDYSSNIADWEKFRLTLKGGREFIDKYLEKLSVREDDTDFNSRKKMSHCPAHAKATLLEIKNSIYQRMADIKRSGGTKSYQDAVLGRGTGVDNFGNSMNGFIGRALLPELLALAKVGVFVDRDILPEVPTRMDTASIRPYLYMYGAEDIRSWSWSNDNSLDALLLRNQEEEINEFGLVTKFKTTFRLFIRGEEGITVQEFDDEGNQVTPDIDFLDLAEIPFVLFELSQSLLEDVADYQISLLNLSSSDMNYALKSNYPFYTEQYDPRSEMVHLRQATSNRNEYDEEGVPVVSTTSGTAENAETAKANEINVGATQGRRYPKGIDRPEFIAPPSAPLLASMEKQSELRGEIRQLMNLAITNLKPVRASEGSKGMDAKSLESGLSYIGLELEYGERQISKIWAAYENASTEATINYPKNYSLRSEEDRLEEATKLEDHIANTPSMALKKVLAKEVAETLVGHKVDNDTLTTIHEEIDGAKVIVTDPDIIKQDHEAGFVGTNLASQLRGYPEGEVDQAAKDHAERATRILAAQTAARGVNDLGNDDPDDEKKFSQDSDVQDDAKKAVRS